MTAELIVTSAAGEPVIRTASAEDAHRWASFLGGHILTEGTAA